MRAEERIAELDALVERQREQIAVLLARVRDLEARLAKDSHTSGKPPASDGLARKTRSLRKHSGKKPGGQLGHRGERLRREVVPDEVIAHRPPVCAASRQPLREEAAVVLRERRQVHEVPPLRLHIREHQVAHVRSPQSAVHLGHGRHVSARGIQPSAMRAAFGRSRRLSGRAATGALRARARAAR